MPVDVAFDLPSAVTQKRVKNSKVFIRQYLRSPVIAIIDIK